MRRRAGITSNCSSRNWSSARSGRWWKRREPIPDCSPESTLLLKPAEGRVNAGRGRVARLRRRIDPLHGVGDHAAHFRLMVDRIGLMAGAEVEDTALPARKAAAASKHLAAFEGTQEDQ